MSSVKVEKFGPFPRVNRPVFIASALLIVGFIIFGSLLVGSYIVPSETQLVFDTSITFTAIKNNMQQYLVGSFILALSTAVILGFLSFLLLTFFNTFKNKK